MAARHDVRRTPWWASSHDDARSIVRSRGLASLAEPWWVRTGSDTDWQQAHLLEVATDRIRLRWTDPLADQPPMAGG